jgi:hypothetical protein
MPNLSAKEYRSSLEHMLDQLDGLGHLRVRARGTVLTLESGHLDEPVPHARFRRHTANLWTLEMPVRGGRWERTPFRDTLEDLLEVVTQTFPWTLAPIS